MAVGSEEISAAFANAAETDVTETTTVETPENGAVKESAKTSEGKKEKGQVVPKSRLDEVIGQRNEFKENYETLQSKFNETQEALQQLTKLYATAKEDADVLAEVRALGKDPKYSDHVRALHNALTGIEEDVAKGKVTEEEGAAKANKIIEAKHKELANELQEQKLDMLTQRADSIADQWLAALPEQYTDQDKEVIAHLWSSLTDFDDIEQDPSQMMDILRDTFQKSIDTFGSPRGGLIDPETLEEVNPEEFQTDPDPDELLAQLVQGKEYSNFVKEKSATGRETIKPSVSDEDFTRDLALAMKIANQKR